MLAGEVAHLLAPWLRTDVEHIGSTAVPGLPAKPVIDLMAAVDDPAAVADAAGERLDEAGWALVPPELDRRPWRRFFVKPDDAGLRRLAHLHLIRPDEPRWAEQLAFRDRLRADRALAQRYADLKTTLGCQFGDDREGYTEAKAEFIRAALLPGS